MGEYPPPQRCAGQEAGKSSTKLIKEIVVAVKGGGPDPDANPRLRAAIQNARAQNMPKDNIERAVKASGAGGEEYKETTFEGYDPDGIAVLSSVPRITPIAP